MATEKKKNHSQYGIFTVNTGRMLISLVIGITCWLFIHNFSGESNNRLEIIENVPVIISSQSEDIYISPDTQDIKFVDLKVSIEYSMRNRKFTADEFEIHIDPSKIKNLPNSSAQSIHGHPIPLTDEFVAQKPEGLKIIDFSPAVIPVRFDTKKTKIVPVKVDYTSSNIAAIRITPTPRPSRVQITGPGRLVDSIHEISTEKINLSHTYRTTSYKQNCHMMPIESIQINPSDIEVDIEVHNIYENEIRHYEVPVGILFPTDTNLKITKIGLTSFRINVNLSSSRDTLDDLQNSGIKAFIDLTDFKTPGAHMADIKLLNLPPSVSVEYQEIEKTPVTLEIRSNFVNEDYSAADGQPDLQHSIENQ